MHFFSLCIQSDMRVIFAKSKQPTRATKVSFPLCCWLTTITSFNHGTLSQRFPNICSTNAFIPVGDLTLRLSGSAFKNTGYDFNFRLALRVTVKWRLGAVCSRLISALVRVNFCIPIGFDWMYWKVKFLQIQILKILISCKWIMRQLEYTPKSKNTYSPKKRCES